MLDITAHRLWENTEDSVNFCDLDKTRNWSINLKTNINFWWNYVKGVGGKNYLSTSINQIQYTIPKASRKPSKLR